MKKVFTLLFLFLLVGFVSAQDLTKKFEEAAKQDLKELKTVVLVQENQEQLLFDFFYKKYKQYTLKNLSYERKEEMKIELELELKSFFNSIEIEKLDKNKKILLKLVSE